LQKDKVMVKSFKLIIGSCIIIETIDG